MTYFSQSCSCPPPPTFPSFSLPIHISPSFSFDNLTSNSTSTIDGNHCNPQQQPQQQPISPTNTSFSFSSASAINSSTTTTTSRHLQPLSIPLPFSLSTPSLTRSNSSTTFSTVSTPTSSISQSQTSKQDPQSELESEQGPVDLNQLNSLLYQLASPSTDSSNSASNSKSSISDRRSSRKERRDRFQALLSTFHQATICKLDESNSEELFNSLSELDINYPTAPNSVLQGIGSSMTEPILKSQQQPQQQGELPSIDNPGALILASKIASPFQESIRESIKIRKEKGLSIPKLIGILATPSPPSIAYAEWTKKACQDVGIDFEIWKTWEDNQEVGKEEEGKEGIEKKEEGNGNGNGNGNDDFDLEADVEDLIIAANADKSVHGIMVYYPIFGGRQDTYLQQIVDPRKDVEGLHFSFCWNMYHNVRWLDVSQLGGAPGTTSEVISSSTSSSKSSEQKQQEQKESTSTDLQNSEQPPPGFGKSILPSTSLALVKCLESMGVYDRSLPYGDRLFGKTITIFNRSEVVGRPLAALLSNDGARVFSIDLDGVQEFNKRTGLNQFTTIDPTTITSTTTTITDSNSNTRSRSEQVKKAHERNSAARLRPHHVVRKCSLSNQDCVKVSQVVISGVPSKEFKVPTEWLNPGTYTINFSSEKNFEKDVRTRAGAHLGSIGKTTIAMLQRNLLRLVEYRELAEEKLQEK